MTRGLTSCGILPKPRWVGGERRAASKGGGRLKAWPHLAEQPGLTDWPHIEDN